MLKRRGIKLPVIFVFIEGMSEAQRMLLVRNWEDTG